MTHGVVVAILATLIMQHGGTVKALAGDLHDMILFIDARREGLALIRSLGHQVLPKSDATISKIPTILQVAVMWVVVSSKLGEVGLEYHISQAPDEMAHLAMELKQLVDQAGIPVAAIRKVLGEIPYIRG